MSNPENKQFRLAARPQGMPKDDIWELTREPVPDPEDKQVVVAIEYISLDPAMRGWMNEGKSYIPPIELGAVMRAGAVGEVIASKHPEFKVGDKAGGNIGVQTHALVNGSELRKLDTSLADLPAYLGVLGMPGMTAYFGLLEVGVLKDGDNVLVSAASGAVGALVCQIAKLKGCHVVGIAGGPQKCSYVTDELGADACIDYKNEDVFAAIRKHCAQGVDLYFDNVGGEILDAALANLNLGARVVVCGAVSQYNDMANMYAPKNYLQLLITRSRMEGFIVFDYQKRYPEGAKAMAGWLAEGKLKHKEDIVEGFENFPSTLRKLFTGDNFGKLILKV